MALAFLFPGQGSQSVGMLESLAAQCAVVEETFAEASEVLKFDLWDVVANGPVEELNRTVVTQPAMLCADVAVWRVWRDRGGAVPQVMAGHSLGEYAALVCSGALSLDDAVRVVSQRASLMQSAVPEGAGAMAAVLGLDDDQVRSVCTAAAGTEVVEPVNFNAPGQVVIAGHRAAVERALAAAKAAGAKRALLLPVSVPSHCRLMVPAAVPLAEALAAVSWHRPEVPVVNNADVQAEMTPERIRDALVRQISRPVRWVETITTLVTNYQVDSAVECGPGKVLTGLSKRIARSLTMLPVSDPASLEAALAATEGGEHGR